MVSSEELDLTFKEVANDFDMKGVKAEFAPFRDLKIKWSRTSDWASFEVTDYLRDVPLSVVESLARTVIGRIRGLEIEYPEKVIGYLTSHEFRELNQERYIERSRMIAAPFSGDDRLQRSYERLVDDGLIGRIEDLRLYWSKADGSNKMGESSCLMRVAVMNPKLRGDDVPDSVLDYCLLKQLANIEVGFDPDRRHRSEGIANIMDACPDALRAQSWLEAEGLES